MISATTDDFVGLAKSQLYLMRQRSFFFSQSNFFNDTPWEMLLEIFIACEQREAITAFELAASLTAQPRIVDRWLQVFENCGYTTILQDKESKIISITDVAREECVLFLMTLGNQERGPSPSPQSGG